MRRCIHMFIVTDGNASNYLTLIWITQIEIRVYKKPCHTRTRTPTRTSTRPATTIKLMADLPTRSTHHMQQWIHPQTLSLVCTMESFDNTNIIIMTALQISLHEKSKCHLPSHLSLSRHGQWQYAIRKWCMSTAYISTAFTSYPITTYCYLHHDHAALTLCEAVAQRLLWHRWLASLQAMSSNVSLFAMHEITRCTSIDICYPEMHT
jgi:hypothetical protein